MNSYYLLYAYTVAGSIVNNISWKPHTKTWELWTRFIGRSTQVNTAMLRVRFPLSHLYTVLVKMLFGAAKKLFKKNFNINRKSHNMGANWTLIKKELW